MCSVFQIEASQSNTFNDLGMRAIFDKAAEQIYLQYGKEVHIHTMQQYLTKGAISIFDRKTRSTQVLISMTSCGMPTNSCARRQ